MKNYKVPIQSLIDHIKTAIDVDPWAKEMVEELLKEQEGSGDYQRHDNLPDVLPCPFCGKKPTLQKDVRYPKPEREPKDAYEIVCNTRGCVVYHADNNYWLTPREAITAWNKRA